MKITITRLYDAARFLQTEVGKAAQEFVDYSISAFEQIIRALRNGLTFTDNFNCKISEVFLTHNTAQVINTDGKTPFGILPIRVFSSTTGVSAFSWYINQKGETEVNMEFVGSPADSQRVLLIVLF